MSNLLFPPNLIGLGYPRARMPVWKTGYQEAVSGKTSTIKYMQYPLREWDLRYELLRDDVAVSDLRALEGLFNAVGARADTFLYSDPTFNSVVDENFGTGDNITTAYPITATFQNSGGPGAPELIQNFVIAPVVKVNGVTFTTPAQYTLGPTGIVTFVSAPTGGHAITWTGSFYYRCRFLQDRWNLREFMNRWWDVSLGFRSIKL